MAKWTGAELPDLTVGIMRSPARRSARLGRHDPHWRSRRYRPFEAYAATQSLPPASYTGPDGMRECPAVQIPDARAKDPESRRWLAR